MKSESKDEVHISRDRISRDDISRDEGSGLETKSPRVEAPDFAVQPSYVRIVFWGPDGLRAGWGFAFYVAMFYVGQYFVLRLAASVELGANGLWSMMLEEFGLLCAAVVPALVLGRVERRSVGNLWTAGARGIREIILGGDDMGIREHDVADGFDVWLASF